MFRYERIARASGHTVVAGIDEAGRGPLAGPVVAACVVLPADFAAAGIDDSKKLTAPRREAAYDIISLRSVAVGIGIVHSADIDQINILRATHLAMRLAFLSLEPPITPTHLLVDGLPVPGLPCTSVQALVGGDAASVSIAAASIIAKVTRDRMMVQFDRLYPGYGFAQHKGYGAATHLKALRLLGPSPIHRRTFAPVSELCQTALWAER